MLKRFYKCIDDRRVHVNFTRKTCVTGDMLLQGSGTRPTFYLACGPEAVLNRASGILSYKVWENRATNVGSFVVVLGAHFQGFIQGSGAARVPGEIILIALAIDKPPSTFASTSKSEYP